MDPKRRVPIAFAHRGARAHAPENTLEAFALARRMGATGLESDVWLTADGVAVLDHDGVVVGERGRRPIAELNRGELPAHIPELAEMYAACGTDYELSLDVKDAAAIDAVLDVARDAGALRRLWLCHHDWQTVASWRRRSDEVALVDSTSRHHMREGPQTRAARLAAAGVDVVNLHHSEWSRDLVALFQASGLRAFGWDAQRAEVLDGLLEMGIDAVYSDHVDAMTEALARCRKRRSG